MFLYIFSCAGWIQHLKTLVVEDRMEEADVMHFLRIEFQDGTRKDPTQDYHGSGRPHLHGVLWTDDLQAMHLEDKISATLENLQDTPEMRAYVEAGQPGRNDTPLPIREKPSTWNAESKMYEFQHTAEDKRRGIRAFFIILMEAMKGCHQDLPCSSFVLNFYLCLLCMSLECHVTIHICICASTW